MATPHAPGFTALFVSAERPELDAVQNLSRTLDLMARLEQAGFTFDSVVGKYQGRVEYSYRVCLSSYSVALAQFTADAVRRLSREYDQESVLVVSPLGEAVLVYDDRAERIGQWSRCSETELEFSDYSRIGDEFFTVVPDIEVQS